MHELININYESDRPTVLARELHEMLEVKTAYKDWFPRMCEYGFSEGTDYCSILSDRIDGLPGKPRNDAQLTIDMAKEICMLQRTEKGKQCRQYFIQLEKDWNSPEKVMARALKIADQKILQLQGENAIQKQLICEMKPKADYVDYILKNPGLVTINQIAKDYGISGRKLNGMLHDSGIQYKQGDQWLLYARYQDRGYTQSETIDIIRADGRSDITLRTKWTQKGRLFLHEFLRAKGIKPNIEKL